MQRADWRIVKSAERDLPDTYELAELAGRPGNPVRNPMPYARGD